MPGFGKGEKSLQFGKKVTKVHFEKQDEYFFIIGFIRQLKLTANSVLFIHFLINNMETFL
jgi:hypothetical protein